MNSFRKSNLQNIKNIFEEKTGVELESAPVWRYPIKKYVVIAAVLVCSFTMTAFAASLFSSLSGDDLSLSSTYEGNGIVSIQVENKSDKDLNFQKQLKLMRWSTSEEIAPLSDNIIFENTEIKANTSGTMTIDLSAAYDFSVLEQPLVDDHYYFVLTNNNFLFGQDWMCSIEFTEPIITPIQEPTPINPVEADKVSASKVTEKLQHYFDTYIADPLEWQARNEEYLSDCAQLLNDLDGNVVPSVAPHLLVDMLNPGVIFDETVPADKQHWLTGEHHKPIDGYNLPIGSTLDEKALVLSAYVPQHRGEFDGGVDVPLVYIMTYEVDSIQSSEDYAFIRGQLLTFAEMEQYKVYEDEKYICFNVTELFYTDLRTHVESMISQRSDVYFDEQIWERVQNIYNYCMDKENLEGSFYYIDDGEPSTQGLSSMKLDSRGENGENSLAYLDTLRDNISQAILNKELNFVSSCWVDEASRTVKVGITEMKEEYIQRLKEFENMGPALDIFQQDLPVDE